MKCPKINVKFGDIEKEFAKEFGVRHDSLSRILVVNSMSLKNVKRRGSCGSECPSLAYT